jgi:hypothetical protein
MHIRAVTYILILAMSYASIASATISTRSDIFLFGDHRSLNQNQFSVHDDLNEFSGAIGFDLTYSHENIQLNVRPEVRWIYSEGVGVNSEDISRVSVLGPNRFFNLGGVIEKTSTSEAVGELEKLNVSVQTEHVEFAIGRRALGLGVLKFLPVWNKFTAILPTQAGPPYIYNPDNAVLRYQSGVWSTAVLGIAGYSSQDAVSLGQLNYFGDWIEVQSIFGYWWEEVVAGIAFTKDISGLTLRSENLCIGLKATKQDRFCQIGLGLEYVFTDKLSTTIEGLYSENGANSVSDYQLTLPSRFDSFRASRYALVSVEYKYLPDWRLIISPMTNLVDNSTLLLADLRWSATDDSEMVLQSKTPLGPSLTEFSSKALSYPNGSYVGYPNIINLYYKIFF